jgi:hypothetical protein
VFERYNGEPVPRAGVWAINISNIEVESNNTEACAELAREKGYFIGYTDINGETIHRFREPGLYVMAAFKDGYLPGLAKIKIISLETAEVKIKLSDVKPSLETDDVKATELQAEISASKAEENKAENSTVNKINADYAQPVKYTEINKTGTNFSEWADGIFVRLIQWANQHIPLGK